MTPNFVIKTENLSKIFRTGLLLKPHRALDSLNLTVQRGEIFGYLGPNGSGKTTTFKLLLGLIFPDKGSMHFFDNLNSIQAKAKIGYLPENPYFYTYLTASESMELHGGLYGMNKKLCKKRSAELLEQVGLDHAHNIQLRKFSRGMLQRIGVAQALINDPDLLILDEPMSGLDPMGRKKMRDLIINCRDQGKTVIFSSHILSDVEIMCDRAAIILKGKLQEVVSVSDILNREVKYWEITCTDLSDEMTNSLQTDTISVIRTGQQILIKCNKEVQAKELIKQIDAQGGKMISFSPHRESLEEIFIKQAERTD